MDEAYNEFLVWTEEPDPWCWRKTIYSTIPVDGVKNPTALVRKVWKIVQAYIYRHRLPLFHLHAHEPRLLSIYNRFLAKLNGYTVQSHGTLRWVFRTNQMHETE